VNCKLFHFIHFQFPSLTSPVEIPLHIASSIMEGQANIRTLFASAKNQRKQLEVSSDPTSALYQENLQAAIATLEECQRIADRISLFGPNETEDDISSGDLQ